MGLKKTQAVVYAKRRRRRNLQGSSNLVSPSSLKEARGALCPKHTVPQEACSDHKLHLRYMLSTVAKCQRQLWSIKLKGRNKSISLFQKFTSWKSLIWESYKIVRKNTKLWLASHFLQIVALPHLFEKLKYFQSQIHFSEFLKISIF